MINKIKYERILVFEDIFPEEKPLSAIEYLKGGDKNLILNVASFFLGYKSLNSKTVDNKKLLFDVFGPSNNEFAYGIYAKIIDIEKEGEIIRIINVYSSLMLFELFFTQNEIAVTQSDGEFEKNLFKAYLTLNSEFISKQLIAFSSTEKCDASMKLSLQYFCSQYPIADKMNYNINHIWITQIIKAICLFQFLESDNNTKYLLDSFLNNFDSKSWKEYLMKIIPLTTSAFNNTNAAYTDIHVNPGTKFQSDCEFIEKLSLIANEELKDYDFISLRSTPFYKIDEGIYRIIFDLFAIEMIFKGLYFKLNSINDNLLVKFKIKEFKSIYGYEFSEKKLFYKAIEDIYNFKCIKFSGNDLDKMNIDGAPDYYIRKRKNILVFESKDFLVKADKKMSFDYEVYKDEFHRLLYLGKKLNEKNKPKAILQLINSIKKILNKEFPADTHYNYRDVFIYPILIIHDNQYDAPGFNYMLNNWFQKELLLLKEEGFFIHNIRPLFVVNIDTLLFHQFGLSQKIPFHKTLNLYEKEISKLIPFSLFLSNLFNDKNIGKIPTLLESVLPELFV